MRLALALLASALPAAGLVVGSAAGSVPAVALTVVHDGGPDRPALRSTLRCTSAGASGTGRLRDLATRACRVARAQRQVLHGARSDGPCTELHGGPQTARISGTVGTKRVLRRFDRTDGCRIAEWDALVPLVPRPRSVSGP